MSNDRPKLASGLARLGLEVPDDGVDKLLAYMALLQSMLSPIP